MQSAHMVLILGGSSEHNAYVRSEICQLTPSRHFFNGQQLSNFCFHVGPVYCKRTHSVLSYDEIWTVFWTTSFASLRTAGAKEADVEGDELGVLHSHRGQQLDGKERNGVGSCHR